MIVGFWESRFFPFCEVCLVFFFFFSGCFIQLFDWDPKMRFSIGIIRCVFFPVSEATVEVV